jgi:hypothetical protein
VFKPETARVPGRAVIWIFLAAIFMPYTIAIFVGDLKFTPGKLAVVVFVFPAFVVFLSQISKGQRRLMAADFFAFTTALWLIAIPMVANSIAFVTAISMALEFLGSYLIARAYFSNEPALKEFIKAFKVILFVVIALALLDTLSGRLVTNEITAGIFNMPDLISARGDDHFRRELFGFSIIRATSTLDHPILYGTFCAIAGAVLLYAERDATRRTFYLALCTAGCLLSASSAPLLGLILAVSVFTYDALLAREGWRWKLLLAVLIVALGAVFVISQNPISWLIRHLTLDSQTGYFRLLIWDRAFAVIDTGPWIGNVAAVAQDEILSVSTDSVWLIEAMTFGIPLVVLHLFTNICAFAFSPPPSVAPGRPLSQRLATGLTLSIVLFVFIGLTVHFWNALWLFWALCIGMRTSLRESEFGLPSRAPLPARALGPINLRYRRIGAMIR